MKRQNVTFWFNKWFENEKFVDLQEIQDRLEAKGIAVTQTTLSRDLRSGSKSGETERWVSIIFCHHLVWALSCEISISNMSAASSLSHRKSRCYHFTYHVWTEELGESSSLGQWCRWNVRWAYFGNSSRGQYPVIVCQDQRQPWNSRMKF